MATLIYESRCRLCLHLAAAVAAVETVGGWGVHCLIALLFLSSLWFGLMGFLVGLVLLGGLGFGWVLVFRRGVTPWSWMDHADYLKPWGRVPVALGVRYVCLECPDHPLVLVEKENWKVHATHLCLEHKFYVVSGDMLLSGRKAIWRLLRALL